MDTRRGLLNPRTGVMDAVQAMVAVEDPPELQSLSLRDRHLFRLFGEGPAETLPYVHIHHAFERWAQRTPDAVAAEHLGQTISYGELNGRADRLARRLTELGVRPGDNVGLFVSRSIPMLVGLLAALKVGAAYVPQDPRIVPQTQLSHAIRAAGTRVILTLDRFTEVVPVPEGHVIIVLETVMGEAPPPVTTGGTFVPAQPIDPDSGCYVLFTSGTTGKPNGVTVTHRNVCNLLLTEPGGLGIRPGWRVSQILNIGFDMAVWEILGCLSHGGTLVIRGKGHRRDRARGRRRHRDPERSRSGGPSPVPRGEGGRGCG